MSSLLPPNSTRLEKSLEYCSARVELLPVPFVQLSRIDECPVSHLPWLAWEHRVEYWDPSWNDQQKRDAIHASKDFNTQRGTRASLRALIETVVNQYQIVAWHQQVPKGQPYTFSVIVAEAILLTIEQLSQLHTAIDATKSQRDLYGINARVSTSAFLLVAGAVVTGEQVYLTSQ
ncbi:phage tail protein I [Acinetobacter dispersus]|uniref:phage tail protein I n=1 Tax=Acinetobacter dispersus TaxID=70348 RepID=UPI00132ECA16|nr:phage tail protein I [Acinetobacter dispersus]QHH99236.1 phage tail protein I [Acinetobacter dispersus]